MKLYEYQAKKIFGNHGIEVPPGIVVESVEQIKDLTQDYLPVVLKPQLSVKGRGKVGGILFADTRTEAVQQAEKLFAMTIKGEKVKRILIEKKIEIIQEYYLSVAIDYSMRKPLAMVSSQGGIAIEDTAQADPQKILKLHLSPTQDIDGKFLDKVDQELEKNAGKILQTMYDIFRKYDAEMIEINPLVQTNDGKLIAVDAVLNINEDSLFRQPEIIEFKQATVDVNSREERARANNWTYIELGGNIGILSSGAGITMTILDLLSEKGGKPANFLDTAQMDQEGLYQAFELLLENPDVEVALVNIFAGLNRCDHLALGIANFVEQRKPSQPVVVRMVGNREEQGHEILRKAGIEPVKKLEQAIEETMRRLS